MKKCLKNIGIHFCENIIMSLIGDDICSYRQFIMNKLYSHESEYKYFIVLLLRQKRCQSKCPKLCLTKHALSIQILRNL